MKSIAILTPSYLPDLQSFVRLHESVLRCTEVETRHHVIVPRRDLEAFREIRSPRLQVWAESDFLPASFRPTDRLAALRRRLPILPSTINCSAINLRRPWPPVRGWILQQILKLSAATELQSDAVVIIDSDVILLRPMPAATYFQDDTVRLYEKPGAVTADLERHKRWTRTAYDLLGIPWQGEPSFPDYVGGIVSWDPNVVRDCRQRIESVTESDWATAVAGCLHFSEFILYGTYLRHFGTEGQLSFRGSSTLCHSYWSPSPLVGRGADSFLSAYDPRDLAVHVQSNSGTSQDVIDRIVAELASRRAS